MAEHEARPCPACGAVFECKAGSVALCQCASVRLDDAERDHLRALYADCLCAACLVRLRGAFREGRQKRRLRDLAGRAV